MSTQDVMHSVRQQIRGTFAQLGASPDREIEETILIRDGFYCGRRFECDGLHAIWFVEENEVKYYGRDGSVWQVGEARPTVVHSRVA